MRRLVVPRSIPMVPFLKYVAALLPLAVLPALAGDDEDGKSASGSSPCDSLYSRNSSSYSSHSASILWRAL